MTDELPQTLQGGEPARLFPVLAETSKEGRALSVLLACLGSVDDLARTLLSTLGQRVGVRFRVRAFTEVVLSNASEGVSGRPDGLIVVETGRRSWSALVEAKVRRSRLEPAQVEAYLKLAKANGVDALVTISNDFAAVPHHHPVRVARTPRGVGLYHWSWTSILTHAKVLLAAKSVDDPEQRFLLAELVRFLDHPSTGVMRFDRMDGNWKDIVTSVVAGAPLSRSSEAVMDTVANWHQECRDLALKLMVRVNSNVAIRLPQTHRFDPQRRIADDAERLAATSTLAVEFNVPDAASPIRVEVDLRNALDSGAYDPARANGSEVGSGTHELAAASARRKRTRRPPHQGGFSRPEHSRARDSGDGAGGRGHTARPQCQSCAHGVRSTPSPGRRRPFRRGEDVRR